MSDKQKTLSDIIQFKGKGLHTGADVEIAIKPAQENSGYHFKRIDIDGEPMIRAIADNVTHTERGTTLVEKGVSVSTVEHVLAALSGMGIDNALIELNGPEVPIMDGSSRFFAEAIARVGYREQEADRYYYRIREKMVYRDEKKGIELLAYPDDTLTIDVHIDYDSKVLGYQYAHYSENHQFDKEFAPCRTFVFLHELETLQKHNLIRGGDFDNAIVIIDRPVTQEELDHLADLFNKPKIKVRPEGILNNVELYFSNEPARHKLLDVIGDLALSGARIKGKIIATRPGHLANTEMAKILRKHIKIEQNKPVAPDYDPNKEPLFDVNEIMRRLPHRHPFLLVDKITHLDEWVVTGIKNVTMNEAFFVGHYPDQPVMPGVLQIEALAQVGGILLLSFVPDPENYVLYFLRIDSVRFKRKVVPGDTLNIRMVLKEPVRRGIALCYGQGFVGDQIVIEAEFMAQMAPKPNSSKS
ncbi:MAG: bifunctional UDP-3-O-[3-hydroxymyristoyl] N-acetylglucosamine deacetylase/3-hydroxyacyl-ACP dehydratase [Bacteroidales bacterium]|nr:bifunctional UDP-3-O-[3-hydroxymyristoyl] N-acetylglucosamine deacetylase/3-hydroxyacyl-ACP dehydratase [Bacteroidales bacterium]